MHGIITLALVALAAALSCPARAEVLIGVAGPMTGKLEWTGTQLKRGAEVAVPTSMRRAASSTSKCGSSRSMTFAIPSKRWLLPKSLWLTV
jgi:hypothetical protein